MTTVKIHRRDFLRVSATGAAGLVLGFTLPERDKLEAQFPPPPVGRPNAYIRIAPDETVTFTLPKVEMGQGPVTSLSQSLADELDADWSKVQLARCSGQECRGPRVRLHPGGVGTPSRSPRPP